MSIRFGETKSVELFVPEDKGSGKPEAQEQLHTRIKKNLTCTSGKALSTHGRNCFVLLKIFQILYPGLSNQYVTALAAQQK